MKSYRVKLQRKVIFEATVEIKAPSSMEAFDIVSKMAEHGELPVFVETKHTEPKVVSIDATLS